MSAGCDDEEPCRELARELCGQRSEEDCRRVDAWLHDTLRTAEGQSLTADQADMACQVIRKNQEVVERYRAEARRMLVSGARPTGSPTSPSAANAP